MLNSRLCAALATATLLLSGCGTLGLGSDGTVTLKLVAADYGDSEANSSTHYWNDVVSRFEAANPKIKVDVQVLAWTDIDAKVAAMVKSGHSPDIVQTGGFADKAQANELYPVREVLSMDTEANLLNVFDQAGQVLGTQYGMPFVSSSRAFFYNKAIFAQAGISQPPVTWADLKADADLIRAKVPGVTPYALPLGPEEAQAESMMWINSGGGQLADDAGNYALNSSQNINTFTWLRTNLVETHDTYPDPSTVDRGKAFADFAAGKVAMLNGHPTLIQQAAQGKIDYGTAPIPRKDAAAKPTTLGVADWMMAFTANGHRDQIRTFLNFAYLKQNMLKLDETYNFLPVTQDSLDAMTAGGQHNDLKPFLDALPNASFYPYGDPAWDTVSGRLKKDIGKAVKGDPGQQLGTLEQYATDQAKSARQQ
ncbi:multiple sugar transport system substrate-binding protein [Kitasatospora sp. MAA4]|uniref:extracellular solute-binding protein n=1 Tax=Kitasatospora sp. MAA4 TaxID=3035093 RepID=UPI002476A9A8|nr:extracellular solute-binding protein [Kitasatospora sp. MAA4]MDH6133896.1 multiple sugar transport system substrate-binding protein [Kitasatospora sp. MAA4]